jgi:hypothetical protein
MNSPELSFESLTVMSPKGPVPIKSDITIPQGYARFCEHKHLTLRSNGGLVRPVANWGNGMWLPSYTDYVYQARFVSLAFLVCRKPDSLGVIQF